MEANAPHISRKGTRNASLLIVFGSSLAALLLGIGTGPQARNELLDGRAPTPEELRPSVEAAFQREGYAPGMHASLVFFNTARNVTVQILRTGPEHARTVGYSEMQGVTVASAKAVGDVRAGRRFQLTIGDWTSGLYFARLECADGRIGFAPFVVRPRRLGEHRIAVVMPTMTWQAYNLRDDNKDGKGDSWYADWTHHTARLARPFLNRGVPYNFRRYDLPFLHWLSWTKRDVDYLADVDLDTVQSGRALAGAYDLIVFPGHHEYVTTREYDVITRYRDLGGNLAFLSANNFFWRIVKRGNTMERTTQWRDLGRPESSLIGTQYRGNDSGQHRGPWIVRNVDAAPWLFEGTGLRDGAMFGSGGIEIDKTSISSPRGVKVLAEIPNLFGPGFTAQMTYYETRSGAKVFAAGAFTLAGSVIDNPTVTKLLENLWKQLGTDPSGDL
jgi:hypothetical protein